MAATIIRTRTAPQPKGPYSQAVRAGTHLYVAGQGPFDPRGGRITSKNIKGQTEQTLQNLKAILKAANYTLSDVVKVTVFLKNLKDFEAMNTVYRTFFPRKPPARSTVQANLVAPGMLVEIEAVAYRD